MCWEFYSAGQKNQYVHKLKENSDEGIVTSHVGWHASRLFWKCIRAKKTETKREGILLDNKSARKLVLSDVTEQNLSWKRKDEVLHYFNSWLWREVRVTVSVVRDAAETKTAKNLLHEEQKRSETISSEV